VLAGAGRTGLAGAVKDGSVVSGPAPSLLPAAQIKITGTSIELG
jgi:hypothetical protein